MKINEKNLCLFATLPPVDLEGYLMKRGEVNKSYQKRYFILKGNLLFYFERKGDKEVLGVIVLEGCTIELSEDGEQYCFQIVFNGRNNRTYYLCADTQTQMEEWMKALTCAGYEYKKLMVAELQRQLDEIEGSKEATTLTAPQSNFAPKPPPRRHNPFNRQPTAPASSSSSSLSSTTIIEQLTPIASTSHLTNNNLINPSKPFENGISTTSFHNNNTNNITADIASSTSIMLNNITSFTGNTSSSSTLSTISSTNINNQPNNNNDNNNINFMNFESTPTDGDDGTDPQSSDTNPFKKKSLSHQLIDDDSLECNFDNVHAAFGKRILWELNERRNAKELAERPLIEI